MCPDITAPLHSQHWKASFTCVAALDHINCNFSQWNSQNRRKEASLGASFMCEPGQLTKIWKEILLARAPWTELLGCPVKYLLARHEAHSIQYLWNIRNLYFSILLSLSPVTWRPFESYSNLSVSGVDRRTTGEPVTSVVHAEIKFLEYSFQAAHQESRDSVLIAFCLKFIISWHLRMSFESLAPK